MDRRILSYSEILPDGTRKKAGELNFDLYWCDIQWHKKEPSTFKLSVAGLDKDFWFRANSHAEAKSWFIAIKDQISKSTGFLQ